MRERQALMYSNTPPLMYSAKHTLLATICTTTHTLHKTHPPPTTTYLDHGALTSTVGTQHRHSGVERHIDRHTIEDVLFSTRVLEAHISHLQDCLVLGLHTLQKPRLGEVEGLHSSRQLIVGFGFRHTLDKLREVAAVGLELAVVEVQNVCAHLVLESC